MSREKSEVRGQRSEGGGRRGVGSRERNLVAVHGLKLEIGK